MYVQIMCNKIKTPQHLIELAIQLVANYIGGKEFTTSSSLIDHIM